MKQHFVNTKKGSRKFWTSLLKDVTLTISFGKIGTAGRELKKTFKSKGDGKVTLLKLIKEKLPRAYVAVKSIPIVQAKIS
ncbi:MAG: WGR domain-containing protein [Chryseolinea sp.]